VIGPSALAVDPVGTSSIAPVLADLAATLLQVELIEQLTRSLDRIADLLAQLDRVLSEFAQLFGEGGKAGED